VTKSFCYCSTVQVCSALSPLAASSSFSEALAQQSPSAPGLLETAELAASAIATEIAAVPVSLGSPVIKTKGSPSITMKLSLSTQQPSRFGFFGNIIHVTAAMSSESVVGRFCPLADLCFVSVTVVSLAVCRLLEG